MPVVKSAKKKLGQDKKRTIRNAKQETALKDAVKAAKQTPTQKTVSLATSLVDKAAKKNIIHKNKAARLKSSLSKLVGGGKEVKTEKKEEKKVNSKKVVKSSKKSPAKKK